MAFSYNFFSSVMKLLVNIYFFGYCFGKPSLDAAKARRRLGMLARTGRGSDRDKHSAYLLCASWVWWPQMRNQLQNSNNTAGGTMPP